MIPDFENWLSNPHKEILLYPNEILRTPAKPIIDFEGLELVCQEMSKLMHTKRGVGLAAPQIGLPYQFFLIKLKDKEKVFVNPQIEYKKNRETTQLEGCLSLPNIWANVTRPKTIKIKYQDLEGNWQKTGYDGLASRIVQHEFSHLQGILFIDLLSPDELEKIKSALEKFFPEKNSNQP